MAFVIEDVVMDVMAKLDGLHHHEVDHCTFPRFRMATSACNRHL